VTADALYHEVILRLARAATGAGRLEAPDGSAHATTRSAATT
jgi:hypothetical protein